jgi:hypothetical protein
MNAFLSIPLAGSVAERTLGAPFEELLDPRVVEAPELLGRRVGDDPTPVQHADPVCG